MIYRALKRISDIILSVLAIILLSPIFLIIAILIKSDSKGRVFYKHPRIGKNGKPFGMYKFRSMIADADKSFDMLTEEQKAEFNKNYKLDDDPRITKVGAFLRKTSLDELPQFVNVIRGELSIVGPRPIVKDELEAEYTPEEADKFLSVIPGITGYWQANGRSNISYAERKALELYYVEHANLWLDIKIMFKTVFVVIVQKGAK